MCGKKQSPFRPTLRQTRKKSPLFLENRAYQGSSGKVYPLPVTEKNIRQKGRCGIPCHLPENDYLKVMILPEIGGRIQRAYDKTNNYDFVYYNHVIKPALVGLTGPWISGGIEFNWPQHHRPSTYSPVDYFYQEHEDGSATVYVSEIDKMYGTKGMGAFTLYPDKSYIEIKGQLYNRTDMPQTFLWWQIRLFRSMNTLIPYSRRTYMRLWIMENVLFPPSRSLPGNITNTTTLRELIFPATAISRSRLPIWQLILILILSETTMSSWTQGFYMWPTTTFPPERNSGPGKQ